MFHHTRLNSKKHRIKNIKRYMGNYGLTRQLEKMTGGVNGHNRQDIVFLRSIIDRAILDVLLSNDSENRQDSLEWFATSAFDETCRNAGLDVDYTFTLIQRTFNHYKESIYSQDWRCPNVLQRTSIENPIPVEPRPLRDFKNPVNPTNR